MLCLAKKQKNKNKNNNQKKKKKKKNPCGLSWSVFRKTKHSWRHSSPRTVGTSLLPNESNSPLRHGDSTAERMPGIWCRKHWAHGLSPTSGTRYEVSCQTLGHILTVWSWDLFILHSNRFILRFLRVFLCAFNKSYATVLFVTFFRFWICPLIKLKLISDIYFIGELLSLFSYYRWAFVRWAFVLPLVFTTGLCFHGHSRLKLTVDQLVRKSEFGKIWPYSWSVSIFGTFPKIILESWQLWINVSRKACVPCGVCKCVWVILKRVMQVLDLVDYLIAFTH